MRIMGGGGGRGRGYGLVLAQRDVLISLICKIHARFDLEICPGKGLFQGDVDC